MADTTGRAALPQFVATARAGNWWSSKLLPLLAVAYAHLLRARPAPWEALEVVGAALIALCAVAWHAHAVNDLFDVDDDRRAGKANRMAEMSWPMRLALLTLLPAVGLGVAASPILGGGLPLIVLAANFVVFVLYSAPPIRLKTRRWWGVTADAVGAHAIPTLFMLTAMPGGLGSGIGEIAFAVSALTWSLATGLRGIIVHQFLDRDADRAVGLTTVGTTTELAAARRLVLRVLLPAEAVGLVAFVALTIPAAPLLVIAIFVFAAIEIDKLRRNWILPLFEPTETSTERYRPLLNNDVHELWLPNVLALQLGAMGGWFLALPALQIAMFLEPTRRRLRDVLKLASREGSATDTADAANSARSAPARAAIDVSMLADEPNQSNSEVVIAGTYWVVNGVNVFSANLARGLTAAGDSARILLTEASTRLITFREPLMPHPEGALIEELAVKPWESWGAHWGESIRYLESRAPCIYIPNSDWRHSSICPLLSDRVGVVGIVHSDDPLHYDHVLRLGRYWNAIVTVSSTLAQRTAQLLPGLADRIHTIPIGVAIPEVAPKRNFSASEPLRVIYHGSLKVHQKRILDLPKVVEALAAMGVPVQLTIAGGGPDEKLLRERAQSLVDRGLIKFVGVLPHTDIPQLLAQHDVYLLVSEFEGMPNALIEAMGHGVVPVVTRIPSGPSELVRDGNNGFLVAVGDIAGFADRLGLLQRDPAMRARLSAAAFDAVSDAYRVEDMVADYRALFQRVLRDARERRYVRPRAELLHAPVSVAGVKIFPVALPYHAPGVGKFPSAEDYEAFRARIRRLPKAVSPAWHPANLPLPSAGARLSPDVTVVVGVPLWTRSGVNVHSESLVRGLAGRGIKARLLLTEEHTDLVTVDSPRLSRPTDIPVDVLPVARDDGWGAHWGATIRYLERRAPCIYLPTFDWRHACVIPQLARGVFVVGSAFADDPATLEQTERLADYWNAVVVRNTATADAVRKAAPTLDGRITVITDGMSFPRELDRGAPVELEFVDLLACAGNSGTSDGELAALLDALRERGAMGRITVLESGDEPEETEGEESGSEVLSASASDPAWIVRAAWPCSDTVFASALAVVARLNEGELPLDVWRAMGWGCVPLLIHDGDLPDYLRPGENCLAFRSDDVGAIADALVKLSRDAEERGLLALTAHLDAHRSHPSLDDILDRYVELFVAIVSAHDEGKFERPVGSILAPPTEIAGTGIFPVDLPVEVAGVGRFPSQGDVEAFARARLHPVDNLDAQTPDEMERTLSAAE